MHQVFLSLGSNLGDRVANLNKGISLTTSLAGAIRKVSAIYETEPWECKLKNNFYNMAAEIETPLKPQELLTQLKKIEKLCGRKPSNVRFTNRTLDMDILFYDSEIITTDALTIPHAFVHLRKFVLVPLVEIAPDFIHPVLDKSILYLLANCSDDKSVIKVIQ